MIYLTIPLHVQGAHKCVERVSRSNCPVCQEDIHTSRIPSQVRRMMMIVMIVMIMMIMIPLQIPPCNHLIHKTCFDEMVSQGHYACPLCGVSRVMMMMMMKMMMMMMMMMVQGEGGRLVCRRVEGQQGYTWTRETGANISSVVTG